jgi:hypothetical protein
VKSGGSAREEGRRLVTLKLGAEEEEEVGKEWVVSTSRDKEEECEEGVFDGEVDDMFSKGSEGQGRPKGGPPLGLGLRS